jgi:hypothetical protein
MPLEAKLHVNALLKIIERRWKKIVIISKNLPYMYFIEDVCIYKLVGGGAMSEVTVHVKDMHRNKGSKEH